MRRGRRQLCTVVEEEGQRVVKLAQGIGRHPADRVGAKPVAAHSEHGVGLQMSRYAVIAGQSDDIGSLCKVRTIADPHHHRVTGDRAEAVVADNDHIPGAHKSLVGIDVAAIHAAPFPASGVLKSRSLASAQAAQA